MAGVIQRIVSLVPSYTQSVADLGGRERLVGITDYCLLPDAEGLPRVGGPKTLQLAAIEALQPDLILANQEENSRAQIERMQAEGWPVWLTFPQTVEDTLVFVRDLALRLGTKDGLVFAGNLEKAWKDRVVGEPFTWFCPVWQSTYQGQFYWITHNGRTYTSDLLSCLGGTNVFALRERRYPLAADLEDAPAEPAGERDTRYPCVGIAEVVAAAPQVILLPDEPFPFEEDDVAGLCAALEEIPAVRDGRVIRLDGRLLHWCGTTLGEALVRLADIL